MSSPFTPIHRALILIGAGVALLIASRCFTRALEQRRRCESPYIPAIQAALLLLFVIVLVTVACAPSFVNRYGIWLPAVAVVGLAIYAVAVRFEEERKSVSPQLKTKASADKTEANQPQKIVPTLPEEKKRNHYFLWIAAVLGAVLLVVELWEIYLRMAIFVAFFLLFVIPAKDRQTVAKLFGLLALWGVPVLWNGLKVAQFLILSALYGIEPVWSGTIRVTAGRHFIRLSNGEEFHGVPFLLWSLSTLVTLAILAVSWLRLLNWFAKRLCPQMLFPRQA
jgi:Ca2+/Na+ antiporter